MFEFLKGKLAHVDVDYIVVEVNGIGYKVYVPGNLDWGRINNHVVVFTYMSVREDDISLYGFEKKDSLSFFKTLLQVSGIGPKVALAIVASYNLNILYQAILEEDIVMLSKIPGIGKKTAQRIVLELKEKVPATLEVGDTDNIQIQGLNGDKSTNSMEVKNALAALGYSELEINDTIRTIIGDNKSDLTVEEIIKQALKMLSRI